MTRAILFMLALGTAASLLVPLDTEAGWLGKLKGKSTDKTSELDLVPRYDNYPTMGFHLGTLSRDSWTGWRLDELNVQFTRDCVITSNNDDKGEMVEGKQAIITGSRVGDTIIAQRVTILKPNWDAGPKNTQENVIWSDSDPTVGVGNGPS
ncbi:MAG: hypothetical protein KOO60_03445 [Gemmatimonadales bacterium]|nr:hypothetical protein [Gemmatimonadales bacterium]